ncbi:MAG TPA: hypothetical protein VF034_00840 [Gemmatimonadaceae bacterium]
MKSSVIALLLIAAPAAPLAAQAPAKAAAPAVRALPAASATSTDSLGSIAAVRQLPNGNLLVNDQVRRRVVLMDSSLKVIGVVADSTSSTANAYGVRPGGLLAYHGDSTLFIDPASLSMLVIDGAGKVVRVMAAPRPNDVQFLVGGAFGNPGFDAQGRIVYRSFARPNFRRGADGTPQSPEFPDSAALVRFDLATRKLDTAAFFRIPKQNMIVSRGENGRISITTTINPLPVTDDWAVMSDGTIAIVHGRDYRVEFIGADGSHTLADKIPFEWQRLTDEDKVAFIDSTRAAMERRRAEFGRGGAAAGDGAVVFGGGAGGGERQQVITMRMGGGGGGEPPRRGGNRERNGNAANGSSADSANQLPPLNFVSPSDLPDYKPVFGVGSVRADMDDRLWIRTIPTKPSTGVTYDIVDRSGKLVDRIQVPANATIAGFGKGGIVYVGVRDGREIRLQRVRVN